MTCAHNNKSTGPEGVVCTDCGKVVEDTVSFYVPSRLLCNTKDTGKVRTNEALPDKVPGMTYVARYHINERMAQVKMTGPNIPDEIMELIDNHFWEAHTLGLYPEPDKLDKGQVAKLCKEVVVPEEMQYRYRSRKRKRALFTSCSKYAERWYYIKEQLGGLTYILPTKAEAQRLCFLCSCVYGQWDNVRHTDKCTDPGPFCHKRFGCRKNFPNFYYVMHQLCIKENYTHLLPLFPLTNQTKTTKKLDGYISRIWSLLWWGEPKKAAPSQQRQQSRCLGPCTEAKAQSGRQKRPRRRR